MHRAIKTFGNSMFPFFVNGDILYLKKVPFPKIRINDFIAYSKNSKYISHRVIYKKSNNHSYLITKGDNNLKPDNKVYPKDVVGVIKRVKRERKIFNPSDLYLFQSTFYFNEIIKIKQILTKKGVNFVFLKGLPLHLYFEKSHPKRLYADCDILIEKKDLKKTTNILAGLNFKRSLNSLSRLHSALKGKDKEITFYKKNSNFTVVFDIHLEAISLMEQIDCLNSLYPESLIHKMTQSFLEDKRNIKVNHELFPILKNEDLVFYLAMHLFHHNYRGYYRYELLKSVLKKSKIDYIQLERLIINYKTQNFVYPVFITLKNKYHLPIPNSFLVKILASEKALRYWRGKQANFDIFEEQTRIEAGKNRFSNLFYLSPNPFFRKLVIFLKPQVIGSLLWIMSLKLRGNRNNFFLQKLSK